MLEFSAIRHFHDLLFRVPEHFLRNIVFHGGECTALVCQSVVLAFHTFESCAQTARRKKSILRCIHFCKLWRDEVIIHTQIH